MFRRGRMMMIPILVRTISHSSSLLLCVSSYSIIEETRSVVEIICAPIISKYLSQKGYSFKRILIKMIFAHVFLFSISLKYFFLSMFSWVTVHSGIERILRKFWGQVRVFFSNRIILRVATIFTSSAKVLFSRIFFILDAYLKDVPTLFLSNIILSSNFY